MQNNTVEESGEITDEEGGGLKYLQWCTTDIEKPTKGAVGFVLLCPVRGETKTFNKCQKLAATWGYRDFVILYLFPLIVDRASLVVDAIGQNEDEPSHPTKKSWFLSAAKIDTIICAWGDGASVTNMDQRFFELTVNSGVHLYHLGLTKLNNPKNPQRLPLDTAIEPWQHRHCELCRRFVDMNPQPFSSPKDEPRDDRYCLACESKVMANRPEVGAGQRA